MILTNYEQLLEEQIKDMYSAETQLVKVLPKMVDGAVNPQLNQAFKIHLEETRVHVKRLEKAAEDLGFSPGGEFCKGMKGLIQQEEEILQKPGASVVKDAALIAAAQRVEHFEIAAYSTVRSLAERLDHHTIASIFQETLNEEDEADKVLTEIFESMHAVA